MTRIHALHTGDVRIDTALAHETRAPLHPAPESGWFRGERHKRWVPVPAHLIETEDALVLVDTGWHERIRTDPIGALNRLAWTMYQWRQRPGQALPEQLDRLGYRLEDLTHVVMTHLHSDHASGLPYLLGLEVPVLLGPGEWRQANRSPFYLRHQFRHPLHYREADLTPRDDVPGFDLGHDLLGDGRIVLLPTPGHTRGHLSVLVRDEDEALLTADICYDREAFDGDVLPGSVSSRRAARDSLARVRRFASARPDAVLQFGHDANTFAGAAARLATFGERARAA